MSLLTEFEGIFDWRKLELSLSSGHSQQRK
jgi:hypothetical protein